MVQQRLDELRTYNASMGAAAQADKAPAQLIILHRGYDLITPLLHCMSYQALAHEFLEISRTAAKADPPPPPPHISEGVYSTTFQDGGGRRRSKQVLLDDSDPVWVKYRHQFFSKVGQASAAAGSFCAKCHVGVGVCR